MYEDILLPTDDGPATRRVAGEAIDLAAMTGGTVHALYVVDDRSMQKVLSPSSLEVAGISMAERGEAAVGAIADWADAAGVAVEGTVRTGRPAEQILDHAEAVDADVVVMGTHGRVGLERVLLGSVCERVVRLSDRPVLVVNVGTAAAAVETAEAARTAATEALAAAGHGLATFVDDPYRERSTWVVPVETTEGERVNVHVEATSGRTRLAHVE